MKIIAMVRFNSHWAYVFDEPVSFKYREETIEGKRFLIGRSGPFFDILRYKKATASFKAFAGREFSIEMEDGAIRKIKDDWWSSGSPFDDVINITYGTIENLKRCYVFSGGHVFKHTLERMVEEYENRISGPYGYRAGGWRYDYYDFEKVIKFDDERRRYFREKRHLETANKHLIRNVKAWAERARTKPRVRVPAISVKMECAA